MLKYGSLIRLPRFQVNLNLIESVQHKFLKLLGFFEPGIYPLQGIYQEMILPRLILFLEPFNFHIPRFHLLQFLVFYLEK